jgi:hypothetical protein
MKIICCIRRTKLWAEEYKHSEEWLNHWKADSISKIWSSVFRVSYVDFRKRLHSLQLENLREVAFDSVLNQYEYKDENAIVVPTDDDDWFHPDIINMIKQQVEPIVYWNFINYTEGAVKIHSPYLQNMQYIYESNNYFLTQPKDDMLIRDHVYASRTIKNGRYIDSFLSVHNRTLASLSLLWKSLLFSPNPQQELLRLYDVYRQPPMRDSGVPSYFDKYIDNMLKIYRNELQVRKMFY